jgi:membrane fusion protein, multidrug efflux system
MIMNANEIETTLAMKETLPPAHPGRASGVRPSPGAAGSDTTSALGSSATLLPANVAAPEDGRTPGVPASSGSHLEGGRVQTGNPRRLASIVGAVVVGGFVVGMVPRWHARGVALADTRELAVPTVSVAAPAPGHANDGLVLPAEVKPWLEASIYARANGYLKRWDVDIGAHVEAGQLLAEIDTPELNQQLEQAQAQLTLAQANFELAKTTDERWQELLKTASVSAQEAAEKAAARAAAAANVEAVRADVRRLRELQGFQRVVAPFAGTITLRNTDIGDLIVAGSGKELFHLAQTRTLRVYVRVPQTAAPGISRGQTADLVIPNQPGHAVPAKVITTSEAMSVTSRTLLTELEVDNPHGQILADTYAEVRFHDNPADNPLTLPSNSLLFRAEGLQVGVVRPDGTVELRKVEVGRDFGQTVEVLAGLSPADRVILNPTDSLTEGASVHVLNATQNIALK